MGSLFSRAEVEDFYVNEIDFPAKGLFTSTVSCAPYSILLDWTYLQRISFVFGKL